MVFAGSFTLRSRAVIDLLQISDASRPSFLRVNKLIMGTAPLPFFDDLSPLQTEVKVPMVLQKG